jgi:hypothetical protein
MPAFYGDFVLPPMLAQPTDLATYTGAAAPANATILLRSATSLVLDATNQSYYSADPTTGLATDAQIAAAMKTATIIQAAAWAATGYDPLTGGIVTTQVVKSSRAGAASDTFADAAQAAQSRVEAMKHLVPEAERVLRLNNLLLPFPWVFG